MLEKILPQRFISNNTHQIKSLIKNLRVIYSDIDGTLFGPGGCLILDAHKNYTTLPVETIISTLKKGIDIVLVSGRTRLQLRENSRIIGLKNYIAEGGAMIVYNQEEKIILNTGDFKPDSQTIEEKIIKSGAVDFLFKKYKGGLEYHTPWTEARECTVLFRGLINLDEANRLLKENGFGELKLLDNGILRRKIETLDLPEIHAYHLLPRNASKESAVRKDKEIRNIARNECIAIGDALADLPIAEEVGIFFMVRNALESISDDLASEILNYDNVFVTEEELNLGWVEAVNLFI